MDNDPYAFCHRIEKPVAEAFDKAGLAAFESLFRSRFDFGATEQLAEETANLSSRRSASSAFAT
jgi:hypothetical protein